MNRIIRRATVEDMPALQELASQFADHFGEPNPTLDLHAMLPVFFDGSSSMHLYVADAQGVIAGLISWVSLFDMHTGRERVFINDLCVHRDWRRLHVGHQLLTYVYGWARQRGAVKVMWEVWDQNVTAIPFYEGYGANHMREIQIYQLDV